MCMQAAQTKTADIEALLARLADVNDRLSSALSGSNDSRSHTLVRHREILRDYTQVCSEQLGQVCRQWHNCSCGTACVSALLPAGMACRESCQKAVIEWHPNCLARGKRCGAHQVLAAEGLQRVTALTAAGQLFRHEGRPVLSFVLWLQEFRRHKSALGAAQDRATLMSGASERSSLLGANAQSTSSALLRERGQIGGAHQAVRLSSAFGQSKQWGGRCSDC